MNRSRVRARVRLRAPVQTTDPAALAAYVGELRPVLAKLRALADDATVRPAQRVHSRAILRGGSFRGIRELEARFDAPAHPPDTEPSTPAGRGGADPPH